MQDVKLSCNFKCPEMYKARCILDKRHEGSEFEVQLKETILNMQL